jgi:energy-coupling factor transporter transmembrane protein EcfT
MDARGYRGDIGRTRIREYRLTRADLLLTGASWVALVAAVADRLL